jgi:ribosome biogenesis GTPase A
MRKIKLIFDEVDLMMVSWITQNWFEEKQLKERHRTLVIGKTRSGKSSLLKFLSSNPNIRVSSKM